MSGAGLLIAGGNHVDEAQLVQRFSRRPQAGGVDTVVIGQEDLRRFIINNGLF